MVKSSEQPSLEELANALAGIQTQLQKIGSAVATARDGGRPAKRRIARGTPDDTSSPEGGRVLELVRPTKQEPRPVELTERIVQALRGSWEHGGGGERRPMSAEQVAKTTRDTVASVVTALEKMEANGRVTMLARGGDLKLWTWRPGSNATNPERRATVVGLLMEEPLGNGDLIRITGALPKQIENDLVEIRRKEPVWWMNKGSGAHGNIYWLRSDRKPPPDELDGRLAQKSSVRAKSQK